MKLWVLANSQRNNSRGGKRPVDIEVSANAVCCKNSWPKNQRMAVAWNLWHNRGSNMCLWFHCKSVRRSRHRPTSYTSIHSMVCYLHLLLRFLLVLCFPLISKNHFHTSLKSCKTRGLIVYGEIPSPRGLTQSIMNDIDIIINTPNTMRNPPFEKTIGALQKYFQSLFDIPISRNGSLSTIKSGNYSNLSHNLMRYGPSI